MKLSYDTARCRGKQVPFGATYDDPECRTCARSQLLEQSKHTVWIGPVKFDTTCPSKIFNLEGN